MDSTEKKSKSGLKFENLEKREFLFVIKAQIVKVAILHIFNQKKIFFCFNVQIC